MQRAIVYARISRTHDPEDVAGVARQVRDLRARRGQILLLAESGVLAEDEARAAMELVDAKLRAAEIASPPPGSAPGAAASAAVPVLDAWQEATAVERRAAARALLDRVVLKPAPAGKASGNRFDASRIGIVWGS